MDQLVEIQAIRSVIRRSFKGDSFTVIGEILQNAQRSKATEIRFSIDTEGGAISITDNGSGIEDLGALLVLGKSNYSVETISNQHPMGVGFHSILAHEEVRQVTISSCHQKITIDSTSCAAYYGYNGTFTRYALEGIAVAKATSAREARASAGITYGLVGWGLSWFWMYLTITSNSAPLEIDFNP